MSARLQQPHRLPAGVTFATVLGRSTALSSMQCHQHLVCSRRKKRLHTLGIDITHRVHGDTLTARESSDGSAAIEVVGLKKCRRISLFRKSMILEDVSFHVSAGEVVGFLGPNGAGKTTTMRIIAGLSAASAGRVLHSGEPAHPRTLRSLGSLIEAPALYPWMTAEQNLIALGAGTTPAQRQAILSRVDLLTRKPVRAYSQGMRQRLAIAVAILNGERALVLDEPMNGLDPAGTKDFIALLGELKAEGRAILVSSHQLSDMNRMCDRVVLLDAGRVVASGTAESLRANRPWQKARAISGSPSDLLKTVGEHYYFEDDFDSDAVLVDTHDRESLSTVLAGAGLQAEIETIHMSLEDRFLALTRRGGQ